MTDLRQFGYAAGTYQCVCCRCASFFTGDKRSVRCETCAELAQSEYKQKEPEKMTFTKEKLAELQTAIGWCDLMEKFHQEQADRHLEIRDIHNFHLAQKKEVVALKEAATALPHYITALAEAERVLDGISRYCKSRHVTSDHVHVMNTAEQALTTIRQLARGQ